MSALTTKVTTALAVTVGSLTVAAPAMADDGTGTSVTRLALAQAVRHGALALAALAGIVLLSKGLSRYRRSVWRRRWVQRRNAPVVRAEPGWPTGSISGRSVRPHPMAFSGQGGIVSGSVARSATRL